MAGFEDGGEEELFFDSSDSLGTPFDSPSSEKNSAGRRSSELRSFDHAFWHRELKSVSERRSRFLRGMGFNDLMFPLDNRGHGAEESTSSRAVMESNASESVSFQAPVQAEDNRDSHAAQVSIPGGSRSEDVGLMRSFTERDTATSLKEKPKSRDVARERKSGSWWRGLIKRRHGLEFCKNDVSTKHSISPRTARTQVQRHRKRCMEFSALNKGQEIKAHKGSIRILKFNTSGWYLATGGEDRVVRIWQVIEEETSRNLSDPKDPLLEDVEGGKRRLRKKLDGLASVVIPKMAFKIVETPLHEFHGHTSDILDLSWASSDCLLSSSKDKTVRMWKVGSEECLRVFRHNDYVTCIQFNPIDDKYFISGSIDGKVRIWGVAQNRVLDWYDLREIVTAVSYKPDGKGFVVGSIRGKCRTFDCSGGSINLNTQLQIHGRKKSTGKCITGLQFSPVDSRRIMINSADSNIRIASGLDVVHKLRGLRKSKSQRSASFTWDGRYAVSVDEDSRIYIWNTDEPCSGGSAAAKTVRSCELFSSDGATGAVPWPRSGRDASSLVPEYRRGDGRTITGRSNDKDRFSLGGWLFFPDGASRGSSAATWPEEKLLSSTPPPPEPVSPVPAPAAPWSLVIVSANEDGTIRSYHNYGLPVRRPAI